MWPQTTAAATCNLPRELEQCTQEFMGYYLHANSGGRSISWTASVVAPVAPGWRNSTSRGAGMRFATRTPTREGGDCCLHLYTAGLRLATVAGRVSRAGRGLPEDAAVALPNPRRPAADVADGAGHCRPQGHVWQPQARDPV